MIRLMEEGSVMMAIVVHVDGIVAAGDKVKCHQFGRDSNQMVPVKHLGQLRCYCLYERDWEKGEL